MDWLQEIVDVSVEVCTAAPSTSSPRDNVLKITPRQPLRIRLSISFENEGQQKAPQAAALLTQLGEHDLVQAWRTLFRRITLCPYLMGRSGDPTLGSDDSATTTPARSPGRVTGRFAVGVPACWGDEGGALNQQHGVDGSGAEDTPSAADSAPPRSAGKVIDVPCDDMLLVEADGNGGQFPTRIVSSYSVDFIVPGVEDAFLDRKATLGLVLLLPIGRGDEKEGEAEERGEADVTSARDDDSDAMLVILRVLSRAFSRCGEQLSTHTILLGCCYVSVVVMRSLLCQSVTCPLSNDRLVLSLNITNISSSPVVLHGATLDLYSTRSGSGGAEYESSLQQQQQQWAEQRPGPSGSDMRTIDILTKIVTVTPMIVSDDRPPFTLHPEETYSFQFLLEVVPQLCYLLNHKSLQYIYAHYQEKRAEEEEAARGGGGGGGAPVVVTSSGMVSESSVSRVIDCYGVAVTTGEIISVLSSSYASHLFVFYDIGPGAALENNDGLHHRHTSRWSFGV